MGDEPDSDFARLAAASSFHVQHTLRYTLPEPISPHLAARRAGAAFDVPRILEQIGSLAPLVDLLLVELPGGAFSPFTDQLLAADVARAIPGARCLLVAPDRLGVLHDVAACTRACASVGLPLAGLLLNAPDQSDASTGLNAAELPLVTRVPLLAEFPRGAGTAPVREDDPSLPVLRLLL
jgi:dethiobiotin synthetase